MTIMNQPPANPALGTLRLTRDEVQVLRYYRTLSAADREATRCLLQVLQAAPPEFDGRPAKARRTPRIRL
ncbi:hypothetical protein GIV23_24515 [Pseudomonas sp. PA-1-2A]|uniref:hypothetical protein n=1 Tax=Pseudomonas TaxID=286 RepID=UPI001CA6FA5F|nr:MULTISPECIES: hypothetical protein [Pseudomonas]MBY8954239.1 hypothetical protein [Pseudomonas carnis]MCF5694232.1 hypothetical protein [Pseudomonas sp. PA-1-8C]MCF5786061.1 hypothetical protein [Pseudomonas sp. PA-1-6G]MCF5795162.1 hypothetical protein [Pseudomonas sp. PA-1-6B]MCF5800780.1 hypothetical protein [Pseudomonas sp. PA-1-5A]